MLRLRRALAVHVIALAEGVLLVEFIEFKETLGLGSEVILEYSFRSLIR